MSQSCELRSVSIFVVDDHPMMRDGLVTRISAEPGFTICGEAGGIREAMDALENQQPDLVIVDISLQDGHGFDLIKRLRKRLPEVKVLVNSMYEESIYAERALLARKLLLARFASSAACLSSASVRFADSKALE